MLVIKCIYFSSPVLAKCLYVANTIERPKDSSILNIPTASESSVCDKFGSFEEDFLNQPCWGFQFAS